MLCKVRSAAWWSAAWWLTQVSPVERPLWSVINLTREAIVIPHHCAAVAVHSCHVRFKHLLSLPVTLQQQGVITTPPLPPPLPLCQGGYV